MSLILQGSTSGSITLQEPAVAGTTVLDLPATSGNVVVDSATQTLTNKSIAATQLTGTIAAARLPTGSVLQVISTAKTDTFTASLSGTYADITGMSVNITPTSASNKILVTVNLGTVAASNNSAIQILRDSTPIAIGDAATSRTRATMADGNSSGANGGPMSFAFLDSPATTSATTYKVQIWAGVSATNVYVNLGSQDGAFAYRFRTASTITVMEISA
jgi:hypothetical protein